MNEPRWLRWLAVAVIGAGVSASWLLLPAMIGLRVYEIVARQVSSPPSFLIMGLEQAGFFLLVVLALGMAYLRNSHVRVDILRARMPREGRAGIEIAGVALAIVPLVFVVLWFGATFVAGAYEDGERPIAVILKAGLLAGFALLLAAGVVVAARNLRLLGGRTDRLAPDDDAGPGGSRP